MTLDAKDKYYSHKLTRLGLAICTRNRPDQISGMVDNLITISSIPKCLYVIDSSDGEGAFAANAKQLELLRRKNWEVEHIVSDPGLPLQRNVAIRHAMEGAHDLEFLCFLDDDIRVQSSYFETVQKLFDTDEQLLIVGGFDRSDSSMPPRKLLVSLGLEHPQAGKVSSSGLARVPNPLREIEQVDFVPGGIQSIRLSSLNGQLVDESSKIYGEDIEFHLRLGRFGKIASSNLLEVKHLSAITGKDPVPERIIGEQLVRMRLHMCRPDIVKFIPLLVAGILWLTLDSFRSLRVGPANFFSTLRAHARAIALVVAMKIQQSSSGSASIL